MNERQKIRKQMQDEFTKRLILDAAMSIVLAQGTETITMESIAEQAGVGKGTLYLHFSGKPEVIRAAVDALFEPLFRQLDDLLDSDLSPQIKLEHFLSLGLQFFEDNLTLFRILIRDKEALSDPRLEQDSHYWHYQKKISQILDEGVRCGMFRPMNTALVANMIIEANSGQILLKLSGRSENSIAEQVDTVRDILLNGIASP